MFQLKLAVFILSLGCAIPLLSMSEINQTRNVSLRSDAIVPTIEATVMTALATLPQAMMYVPFKEAVEFTMHSGAMTGCLCAMVYTLPTMLFGCLLNGDPVRYSVIVDRFEIIKQSAIVKQPVNKWRKPLSVSLALLITCFMLGMNYIELAHTYGI